MLQRYPKPSANFIKPAASDWLDAISELNTILSAILAVMNPALYDAGWEMVKRLRATPEISSHILNRWASIFSGVSVTSNCDTPAHRDGNSRWNWYEILATLRSYRNCSLELPGVRISLDYSPGTVVGLLGNTLEHKVGGFEGDRVCYAYFIRDNVQDWAKVTASDWMNAKYYK